MKTEEGLLKDKVKRYLDALPRQYRFMPVQQGYGTQTLDFLCCIDGRFVGVETKAAGKKPTPRQNQCIEAIKKAGGAAFYCDSYESFLLNMAAWGLAPHNPKPPTYEEICRDTTETFNRVFRKGSTPWNDA